MKGLILAGGFGTRLGPLTLAVNKHVLPVFDKPMIYYPLSLLLLAGMKDIGIVSSPEGSRQISRLLGCGDQIGINITYIIQDDPGGIPDAIISAQNFIGGDKSMIVLGDNFLYGDRLQARLRDAVRSVDKGCKIFLHNVPDPDRFGVAVLNDGRVNKFVEKPSEHVSDLAVTGVYIFDEEVTQICKALSPSARGELEVVDVLNYYLSIDRVAYDTLGRGAIWWDLGTVAALHNASNFVELTQKYDGRKIANIFEIAINEGLVTEDAVRLSLSKYKPRFEDFYA